MALRLYLDDCANARRLRQLLEAPPHNHDVEDPFEAGIDGCDDDMHLAHARSVDRIIITKNPDDFTDLHDANPHHPGIFVIYQDNRPGDMTAVDIVQAIANLAAAYDEADLTVADQVHKLNEWRY